MSGIVFVLKNALRRRGAPASYAPRKTNVIKLIDGDRTLDKTLYRIEIMFARLKGWRRVHARYIAAPTHSCQLCRSEPSSTIEAGEEGKTPS